MNKYYLVCQYTNVLSSYHKKHNEPKYMWEKFNFSFICKQTRDNNIENFKYQSTTTKILHVTSFLFAFFHMNFDAQMNRIYYILIIN